MAPPWAAVLFSPSFRSSLNPVPPPPPPLHTAGRRWLLCQHQRGAFRGEPARRSPARQRQEPQPWDIPSTEPRGLPSCRGLPQKSALHGTSWPRLSHHTPQVSARPPRSLISLLCPLLCRCWSQQVSGRKPGGASGTLWCWESLVFWRLGFSHLAGGGFGGGFVEFWTVGLGGSWGQKGVGGPQLSFPHMACLGLAAPSPQSVAGAQGRPLGALPPPHVQAPWNLGEGTGLDLWS